jgi:hypothetical protein
VRLSVKNDVHNNYQDFQRFLDNGGRIGLQHDPLLYGAYNLNPFLVAVEMMPMLVVQQGQVAVMKAYVGLATQTAFINVVRELSQGTQRFMPEHLALNLGEGSSDAGGEPVAALPAAKTNGATPPDAEPPVA